MKEFLLKNKLVIMLITVVVLLTTIGLSYAFMPNDVVVTTEGNAGVQVIAGDGYTLRTDRTASEFEKVTGTNYTLFNLTADVTLKAGEQIDTTYDLYYNVKNNNYLEGTTTSTAKVIVKIFNPNGTEITSLTGLSRVTAGSITGFNLTDYTGSIELVKDYAIATNSSITQNWQVKVYLYDTVGLSNISNTSFDSEIEVEEGSVSVSSTQAKDLILSHNGGLEFILLRDKPNFINGSATDEGMFVASDDYGKSFYYRGAVDNNWLYFNGIYWRIVRIAGNGSLKLLYSGTVAPTSETARVMTGVGTQIGTGQFNASFNNNAYVGYKYTFNQRQGTGTNSIISSILDTWYTTNMSVVDSQIVDNVFCYDRTVAKSGYRSSYYATDTGYYTGTGIGTKGTLYGAAGRITAIDSKIVSGGVGPDLECPEKKDAYTSEDSVYGNQALSQKVGLLSVDEVVMGGLVPGSDYSVVNNYLYTSTTYWLGSPFGYNERYDVGSSVWIVYSWPPINYLSADKVTNEHGIRPVIYLSSNAKLTGEGTWNNPYRVAP